MSAVVALGRAGRQAGDSVSGMTNTTPTQPTTTASGLSIAALVTGALALLLSVSDLGAPPYLLTTAATVAIVLGFLSARRRAGSTGIWLARLAVITGALALAALAYASSR